MAYEAGNRRRFSLKRVQRKMEKIVETQIKQQPLLSPEKKNNNNFF